MRFRSLVAELASIVTLVATFCTIGCFGIGLLNFLIALSPPQLADDRDSFALAVVSLVAGVVALLVALGSSRLKRYLRTPRWPPRGFDVLPAMRPEVPDRLIRAGEGIQT